MGTVEGVILRADVAAFSIDEANPISGLNGLIESTPVGTGVAGIGGLLGVLLFFTVLRKIAKLALVVAAIALVVVVGRGVLTDSPSATPDTATHGTSATIDAPLPKS